MKNWKCFISTWIDEYKVLDGTPFCNIRHINDSKSMQFKAIIKWFNLFGMCSRKWILGYFSAIKQTGGKKKDIRIFHCAVYSLPF